MCAVLLCWAKMNWSGLKRKTKTKELSLSISAVKRSNFCV